MHKTFIIAEAGVNHNGSVELAKQLIDVAVDSGADAVKFQTFKTDKNISKKAPKAEYQVTQTGKVESQREMVKKLELDDTAHFELLDYSRKKGIKFMSTGFDLESMDLLFKLGVDILKLPSGDALNGPLILKIAQARLPIIFSTGMCTLGDIEEALGLIAFGYLGWENPSLENFKLAYFSEEGQASLKEKVTLLHCTSEYPTPLTDVNLRAMNTLHQAFGLPVGYSDHTAGITVPIAATALGAVVIEKHFTLDKNMPGPDHQASLEPHELKAMVKGIRDVETALGSSIKFLTKSDQKNAPIGRKSLVAGKDIKKGDIFTEDNIGNMRPGTGISPMHYWELLGRQALNDYNEEDLLQFSEIAKKNMTLSGKNWEDTIVKANASIKEAIQIIDKGGLQIALVVDEDRHLLGTVTDGDIRRGILKDISLDHEVKMIMNANPKTAGINETREMILQRMTNSGLHHIPVIDEEGCVINIELLENLVIVPRRDNEVILIAGGMGTRLKPLTDNYPKPLLKVGHKPILEIILDNYIEYGFKKFTISVNYLSDLIEEYFGNGSKWGVDISYIHENKRMGTAGALSLMDHQPTMPFFVMNADLLTKINFHQLLNFHKEHKSSATMCVRQYEFQVPYGVVNIKDHQLVNIQEKPIHHSFINAGIYVLEPEVLDYIPKDEYFDMPQLFEKVIENNKSATVFPIREYWLDIGQKIDFDKANSEFEGIFG